MDLRQFTPLTLCQRVDDGIAAINARTDSLSSNSAHMRTTGCDPNIGD